MPDNPLADLGGTVVQDAPANPLADLGGVPLAASPMDTAQGYLAGLNSGQPLPSTWQEHYQAGKAFFDQSPAARLGSGIADIAAHPIDSAEKVLSGAGGLVSSAGTGIKNVINEQVDNFGRLPYGVAMGRAIVATGLGAGTGIYNLGRTIDKGAEKVGDIVDSIDPTSSANGQTRAYKDYMQRKADAASAATDQSASNLAGLPSTFSTAESLAPFAIPFAPGIDATALATRIGSGVTDALTPASRLVAVTPQVASDGIGLGDAAAIGTHFVPGGHFFRGLIRVGQALGDDAPEASGGVRSAAGPRLPVPYQGAARAAEETANLASNLSPVAPSDAAIATGQVAGAATNALGAGTTGALYGLADAPTGQEEDAALQGFGSGLALSPVAIIAGGFHRQQTEQLAKNQQLVDRGAAPYGIPVLDAQHEQGIAELSDALQSKVNAVRGYFRGLRTDGGNPITLTVQTPEDFAVGANAANNGQVDDAAGARGYYKNGDGQIFLNSTHNDIPGAIATAIGHEGTHALSDVLSGINPNLAKSLAASIQKSSLNPDGTPTENFQRFINTYADKPVDWSKLPDDDKKYYLNEVGAQTGMVLGALDNPGKFSLKPEASDIALSAIGDWARKTGLINSPDLLNGLRADDDNSPSVAANPEALALTRQAFQAAGQVPRSNLAFPPDAIGARLAPYVIPSEPIPPLSIPPRPVIAPARATRPPRVRTLADGSVITPNVAEPLPVAVYRQTPAYQDALAVVTLPKKSGGLGVKMADAQAYLDRAAQDQSVPDNVTSYVGYVQKAKTAQPAASIQPVAPAQPILAPQGEPLGPPAPIGTSEGKRINLLYGTKRIEVPQSTQPVLTLPKVTPKTELPPVEPVNRFAASSESLDAGPMDQRAISLPQEGDNPTPNQTSDATASEGAPAAESQSTRPDSISASNSSSPTSTPDNSTVASPLSPEDIARIESETEAAHQPNPYPRSSPESRAQKQAADLAKAKADAVAKAHADALPEGDTRVQQRVDPETGRTSFSGTHLVAGDALHDSILSGLSDRDKSQLSSIQDAIQNGTALNVDYHSAPELEAGSATTAAKRQAAQAVSTGADRAVGLASSRLQLGKEYFPQSVSSSNGNVYVHGINIDKFIGNANKAIDLFNQEGRPSPYQDVNSPEFIQDVQGYFRNHANSVSGDGKTILKGTKDVHVPPTPEGYEPYQLSKDKADFINLALGQEGAKTPSRGSKVPSERIQAFARANGIEPTEAGEVNPLRQAVNDAGNFKVDDATGTKKVLENPLHETIRLDNIQDLRPSQGDVADASNLRAQGFRGARGDLTREGLPNAKYASAGFLPAYHGTSRVFAVRDESGLPLTAEEIMDGTHTRPYSYFASNAEDAKRYGANVYAGDISLKNPLNANSLEDLHLAIGDDVPILGKYGRVFQALDDSRVRKSIQDAGYDGVHFDDVSPGGSGGLVPHKATLAFDRVPVSKASFLPAREAGAPATWGELTIPDQEESAAPKNLVLGSQSSALKSLPQPTPNDTPESWVDYLEKAGVHIKTDAQGRYPALMIPDKSIMHMWDNKYGFGKNGLVVVKTNPAYFAFDGGHYARAIENHFSPLAPDEFIRVSNDPNDYAHIKAGTHRGSFNHRDLYAENGLSVSKHFEFPAKYAYKLKGDVIGYGTDREPLLDPAKVQIVGKTRRYEPLQKQFQEDQAERLDDLGWTGKQMGGAMGAFPVPLDKFISHPRVMANSNEPK